MIKVSCWLVAPKELNNSSSVGIVEIGQSRDGGYYGIASGEDYVNPGIWPDSYLLYIFKTDALGQIHQTEEYSEKKQPVMLQPNPALDKVRIVIPYYYGRVYAQFYNMQGVMVFEKTQEEKSLLTSVLWHRACIL
jgi:hypothetical protein